MSTLITCIFQGFFKYIKLLGNIYSSFVLDYNLYWLTSVEQRMSVENNTYDFT